MTRNFEFINRKRVRTISQKTKQEEIGAWKNKLQLQVHFGGVGIPEAERQADCYIMNCQKFPDWIWPKFMVQTLNKKKCFKVQIAIYLLCAMFFLQDVFVMFNTWTEAENYLLVEKLVSKSEEEAWKEIAEMVDGSGTYATEAYKCKAIRKYAAYYGINPEGVDVEDLAKSPHGLKGWAEMSITVPGVGDPPSTLPSMPAGEPGEAGETSPAPKAAPKRAPKVKAAPKRRAETGGSNTPKPKTTKPKKELTADQEVEAKAKVILTQLQFSQQIVNKAAGSGDEIPSEFKWAKPFLEDYQTLLIRFKTCLTPADSEDLSNFVDELKLQVISKSGIKGLKKTYGDRYHHMMGLFVDRCSACAAEKLGCACKLSIQVII